MTSIIEIPVKPYQPRKGKLPSSYRNDKTAVHTTRGGKGLIARLYKRRGAND